ncbi:MAG: helix-turn-helix domain-containing protein [Clostridia bacterium]|nr:helix-turn-helix domain-containing protein [Clostridia bacterium]
MMNNLGELFRQIRINKNWSIREAAKRMGISHSYLSILEKGIDPRTGKDSSPKPDTLRIISKAYDYPYEELMKAAGYLNDDMPTDRKFDLTVFISNINLVMGKMTIEEFSEDIHLRTGYSISPKQIRSYLNGDIEPFPGTISILSNYVGVSPDFWYVFNTEETLVNEQTKYKEELLKSSAAHFNKDYFIFTNINEEIRNWILHEESHPYLKVAMEAHKKKISPNSMKIMIDAMFSEKTR